MKKSNDRHVTLSPQTFNLLGDSKKNLQKFHSGESARLAKRERERQGKKKRKRNKQKKMRRLENSCSGIKKNQLESSQNSAPYKAMVEIACKKSSTLSPFGFRSSDDRASSSCEHPLILTSTCKHSRAHLKTKRAEFNL